MMRFGVMLLLLISLLYGCKRKEYPSGEAIYKGECSKCHTLDGSGGKKGPDLSGIFEKHDEQYMRDYIVDPRSIKPDSTMPPAELDEKQLQMLMEYLKQKSQKHLSANPKTLQER